MNSTFSWAIAAYGNITARQSKFQRRTIGGSNDNASLEVRNSTTRYVLYLLAVIINLRYVPLAFPKLVLFKN